MKISSTTAIHVNNYKNSNISIINRTKQQPISKSDVVSFGIKHEEQSDSDCKIPYDDDICDRILKLVQKLAPTPDKDKLPESTQDCTETKLLDKNIPVETRIGLANNLAVLMYEKINKLEEDYKQGKLHCSSENGILTEIVPKPFQYLQYDEKTLAMLLGISFSNHDSSAYLTYSYLDENGKMVDVTITYEGEEKRPDRLSISGKGIWIPYRLS